MNTTTHHIPVRRAHEESSADDIADERRDHRLPDVVADRNRRVVLPDGDGHEEHVGDDVVEAEAHERERRPPDRGDFAEELTRHEGQETRHAYQPVGADAAQEDLVPFGGDLVRAKS